MLVAYASTGALIVSRAKRDGLELLLRTYAATALSIVALSIVLLIFSRSGLHFAKSLVNLPLDGFSANRNAFAFQLLLAVCAVCAGRWQKSELWLGFIFAGLMFAGSRAALLGVIVVIALALYVRAMPLRKILAAVFLATALFLVIDYGPDLFAYLYSIVLGQKFITVGEITQVVVSPADDLRVQSLLGGWKMFASHPIIGAGLGAFMNQQLRAGNALIIHSTPLWILAEMGLIGFVIFATPVVRIFLIEMTNIRNRDLAGNLLILIIAAFGVVSNAHEMLYQRAFWLLLGAALACTQSSTSSSSNRIQL